MKRDEDIEKYPHSVGLYVYQLAVVAAAAALWFGTLQAGGFVRLVLGALALAVSIYVLIMVILLSVLGFIMIRFIKRL